MKNRYNVVVLGKTGVGKSTFINYLYGKDVMKVGVGKPVTNIGFHHIDFNIGELPVRLFDTWGLEAGKSKQWLNELKREQKKRNTSTSADNWFHTVLFCISGGGARVEQFEIDVIRSFIQEKYVVTVVLTKSDQATQSELDALKSTLHQSLNAEIVVVPVCSEAKELIGGRKTETFGKEQIEEQAYINFWHSISYRLPDRCEKVMLDEVNKWKNEQKNYINSETGIWNDAEIEEELHKRAEKFIKKLNKMNIVIDEISKTINLYRFFAKSLGYPPVSTKDIEGNIGFNFPDERPEDMKWYDWFLLPLLPIYLFSAKQENKEKLNKLLDKIASQIISGVKKMKPKVKEVINSIKIKSS